MGKRQRDRDRDRGGVYAVGEVDLFLFLPHGSALMEGKAFPMGRGRLLGRIVVGRRSERFRCDDVD